MERHTTWGIPTAPRVFILSSILIVQTSKLVDLCGRLSSCLSVSCSVRCLLQHHPCAWDQEVGRGNAGGSYGALLYSLSGQKQPILLPQLWWVKSLFLVHSCTLFTGVWFNGLLLYSANVQRCLLWKNGWLLKCHSSLVPADCGFREAILILKTH